MAVDKEYRSQRQIALAILTKDLIKGGEIEKMADSYDMLIKKGIDPIAAALLIHSSSHSGAGLDATLSIFEDFDAKCLYPKEKR